MKKNKLFVSRYVPYSTRGKRSFFTLKTIALSVLCCAAISVLSFFAAGALPEEFYLKILNKAPSETVAVQAEEEGFNYPKPSAEARTKADRMREIRLEEYKENSYIPKKAELDNIYINDRKKVCYLTFDDGPSSITEDVLKVLKEYKIKATFFVTGDRARNNPQILKKIYKGGHSIGNHSFSHDYNAIYSGAEGFRNEVLLCKEAINSALGLEYDNLLFRFPGGFESLTDEGNKEIYANVLSDLGYRYTDWSCLTGDSNVTDPTPEFLMETLKFGIGNTKTGDIVVLMHDSSTKAVTAQTLPQIIEFLSAEGFKFDVLKN